jgi:hypothetical protein
MKFILLSFIAVISLNLSAQRTTKGMIVKPPTNTTNNNGTNAPSGGGAQNGGNPGGEINGGGNQNNNNDAYNQTVIVNASDDNGPLAYHNITVSQGSSQIGTGQTDGNGTAYISVSNLYGSAVDVEGFYQNGGTKRSWSIKGKLRLDGNNTVNVKLENIKSKINTDNRFGDNPFGDSPFGDSPFGGNNLGSFGDNKISKDSEGQNPMNAKDFKMEMGKIKQEISMMRQDEMVDNLLKNNVLTSEQIGELVKSTRSMMTQEKIAKNGYARCSDPQNYENVISKLTSSMAKDSVRKATIGQ